MIQNIQQYRLVKRAVCMLFFFYVLVFPSVPVYAQTLSPTETPAVVTIASDGVVDAVVQDERFIYIGGNFQNLEINGQNVKQPYFAIVSISSGMPIPDQYTFNAPVDDLIIYDNKLYVAGGFTQVNESDRRSIAVIDTQQNILTERDLAIDGPVHALALHDEILYAGGSFATVQGLPRSNIFALHLRTNQLTTWNPLIDNTVFDMLLAENRLYVGGAFTSINNEPRFYLGAFDIDSGALIYWVPRITQKVVMLEMENNILFVTTQQEIDTNRVQEQTLTVNRDTADTVVTRQIERIVTPIDTITATVDELEPTGEVEGLMVDADALGFQIPSLSDILTFAIRAFFAIAGIAALFFLLLGAFAWVTSGGDKDAIGAARDKIQAAVVGLIMMVVVLAIIWTLEQIVFRRRICVGLSCPLTIPSLIEPI